MQLSYEPPDMGIRFVWSGGQYIDVFVLGEEYPRECINVIGQDGAMTIAPNDAVGFIAECEDWLNGESS